MTLPKIREPAIRALNSQGIYTLGNVSQYTKPSLMEIHGVGLKAMSILEQALFQHQPHFKTGVHSLLPSLLTGDVPCNHAPRRQRMIGFIVATTALDIGLLRSLVATEPAWSVPEHFGIYGPQILIQELSSHYKEIASLNIQSIITHGYFGSIHGGQILKAGKEIHFTHFFEFENHKKDVKLNKVTSCIVVS